MTASRWRPVLRARARILREPLTLRPPGVAQGLRIGRSLLLSSSETRSGPMGCVDENTVLALLHDGMEPGARAVVNAHVDGCEACRQLIAELARRHRPWPRGCERFLWAGAS